MATDIVLGRSQAIARPGWIRETMLTRFSGEIRVRELRWTRYVRDFGGRTVVLSRHGRGKEWWASYADGGVLMLASGDNHRLLGGLMERVDRVLGNELEGARASAEHWKRVALFLADCHAGTATYDRCWDIASVDGALGTTSASRRHRLKSICERAAGMIRGEAEAQCCGEIDVLARLDSAAESLRALEPDKAK